jgi:hypothetical protein
MGSTNIVGDKMTISDAIAQCKSTCLTGWELVEYAQKLVAGNMKYAYFNSFDMPEKAFEKGMGYCWQQAGALNSIILGLGLRSRLVYATRCRFPDVVRDGVTVHIGVSGHVWCRVEISGEEKDACPGRETNSPGKLHFEPLSKVKDFRGPIRIFNYLGSAAINRKRGKKFLEQKAKLEALHNPEKCPCKKKKCERYKKCEECMAYHYAKGGKPYCER